MSITFDVPLDAPDDDWFIKMNYEDFLKFYREQEELIIERYFDVEDVLFEEYDCHLKADFNRLLDDDISDWVALRDINDIPAAFIIRLYVLSNEDKRCTQCLREITEYIYDTNIVKHKFGNDTRTVTTTIKVGYECQKCGHVEDFGKTSIGDDNDKE